MSSASSSSLANESVVHSEAQRNGHDVGTGGTEVGDELLLRFREACKRADGLQPELNNPQKLALYGLFKQATDPNGRAPTAPSRLNLIARAKWEAWYEVRGLSLEHAMTAYIAMVEAVGDSSDGRLSRLGAVAAEPHRLHSVSASRGAHQLRADVAVAQHRVQAQAQHVRADMDHLVKLFAKSKYLAPHTPKLMRHKRVLLPHLQLLTPHRSMPMGRLGAAMSRGSKGAGVGSPGPGRREPPSGGRGLRVALHAPGLIRTVRRQGRAKRAKVSDLAV